MYHYTTLVQITTVNEWQAKEKRSRRSDVILKSYQNQQVFWDHARVFLVPVHRST